MDLLAASHEVSHASVVSPTLTLKIQQNDSIATVPTVGRPVMDTTLKDMLMSLRSLMQNFGHNLNVLENRISHVESNIGDITTTVNNIIDTQESHKEDNKWIRDKLTDMEDRSRSNNIKISGIPASL